MIFVIYRQSAAYGPTYRNFSSILDIDPAFRYRGSHERLDQIWEERHDRL